MLLTMYVPMLHDAKQTRLTSSSDQTTKAVRPNNLEQIATIMPTERQTTAYVEPMQPATRIFPENNQRVISQIRSFRQAPSTILTEQYLQARASASPVYIQNMGAVRTERISNLFSEAPRFRNQIDMLA